MCRAQARGEGLPKSGLSNGPKTAPRWRPSACATDSAMPRSLDPFASCWFPRPITNCSPVAGSSRQEAILSALPLILRLYLRHAIPIELNAYWPKKLGQVTVARVLVDTVRQKWQLPHWKRWTSEMLTNMPLSGVCVCVCV